MDSSNENKGDHQLFSEMGSVAIHAGGKGNADHAHLTPVYATSTFLFDSAEQGMDRFSRKEKGFIYSRFANPTTSMAAEIIASLEAFKLGSGTGAPLQLKAILHASGQAALATMLLSNLSAGDSVLSHFSLYGGTHQFLFDILPKYGIHSHIADFRDTDQLEVIIKKNPSIKLIHIETPANPTMDCTDLETVIGIAKRQGILVSVDNTFATPYLQQPFKYGADFVFHSTTKFMNGHGTAIGGVLIGRDINFMTTTAQKFYELLGGTSSPFDAFLLIQGLKTLEIRMEKHCQNARSVAAFLSGHPAIAKVNYNGLPAHMDFHIAQKQMRHAGAVLSFELGKGMEAGKKFINQLKMCTRAVSVGTADTLVSHPASMSHSGMKVEDRLRSGITDGLIRMSVGLEAIDDILNDLGQALSHL